MEVNDKAKEIKKALKAEFPDFKFSVSAKGEFIDIIVLSGNIDFANRIKNKHKDFTSNSYISAKRIYDISKNIYRYIFLFLGTKEKPYVYNR